MNTFVHSHIVIYSRIFAARCACVVSIRSDTCSLPPVYLERASMYLAYQITHLLTTGALVTAATFIPLRTLAGGLRHFSFFAGSMHGINFVPLPITLVLALLCCLCRLGFCTLALLPCVCTSTLQPRRCDPRLEGAQRRPLALLARRRTVCTRRCCRWDSGSGGGGP